jgi:hypothetical protein
MQKIKRDAFLKMTALATLAPLANNLLAQAIPTTGPFANDDLLPRMIVANDKQVDELVEQVKAGYAKFSRKIGYDFSVLAASYCCPASRHYHSADVAALLLTQTQTLKNYQAKDGTVNISNIESPPDTAFLIELLTAGAYLLIKDDSAETATVRNEIKTIMLKSGEAIVNGGIHTPNHRWVISAALARLNALYPDKRYVSRIEDWLGEGIYNDSDGHYPERSGIYSAVENTAFISIGRLLNKPQVFEPVRRNLKMTWFYTEPNGDLVTTDSRRQDQYMTRTIVPYYLQYRYMAIKDKNNYFAAITRFIEQLPGFEEEILNRGLFHFLEEELLQQTLPTASTLPVNFEKLFTTSQLLRIRRGDTTATVFGGVDWPVIIASGRSNSPNFFAYRKGKAILQYVRLSTGFFSMGYFYSEGIKKAGNKYILHKKLEVPYYQPMPKALRKANGDYSLSPSIDNRFWNKMDFKKRPVSNVKTLDTTITFTEKNGTCELTFQVTGLDRIPVTIELCFDESGTLTNVTGPEDNNFFLENGMGKFEKDGDSITFGPGTVADKTIRGLEGERYSTHFGSLRTAGKHVYLTGVTPFTHTLNFS